MPSQRIEPPRTRNGPEPVRVDPEREATGRQRRAGERAEQVERRAAGHDHAAAVGRVEVVGEQRDERDRAERDRQRVGDRQRRQAAATGHGSLTWSRVTCRMPVPIVTAGERSTGDRDAGARADRVQPVVELQRPVAGADALVEHDVPGRGPDAAGVGDLCRRRRRRCRSCGRRACSPAAVPESVVVKVRPRRWRRRRRRARATRR